MSVKDKPNTEDLVAVEVLRIPTEYDSSKNCLTF